MAETSETVKSTRPVGRFAPSPTGRMHAGNIFAALMSWLIVKSRGGRMVLRIEDLDVERSRQSYADQVCRDFEQLGLTWDDGPFYQQGRSEAYEEAFKLLADKGLLYPCFCTRADLHAASAPHRGEKLVYPGTCRSLSAKEIASKSLERHPSYRVKVPERTYVFDDLVQGRFSQELSSECGDYVVRRSDGLFAYQLAVVVDDAAQGVNCIVRGMDLLVSTPQQMYLQDQLGLGRCEYAHVPLIVGERDRRLSKRDRDAALDELLKTYGTASGVIGHIAYIAGLTDADEPVACEDLLGIFDASKLPTMFDDKVQVFWR
ncbi:MAG: tRNA glutamyl-Q(34) synthetase GluQRS [Eggerthellaceae bacterium]|nr:tRNA glutamyl-Q(34) synthetase GluQRS [Eggerthellaceae bacterium]